MMVEIFDSSEKDANLNAQRSLLCIDLVDSDPARYGIWYFSSRVDVHSASRVFVVGMEFVAVADVLSQGLHDLHGHVFGFDLLNVHLKDRDGCTGLALLDYGLVHFI